MWIKICGNTNLTDAQHAANSGASAVGFVFAPSPRRVTIEQVSAISPRMPRNVDRYGVFVHAGFEEIVATVRDADLTGVQLHANDDPELPARLRTHFAGEGNRARLGIISVLPFSNEIAQQLEAIVRDPAHAGAIDALLIDSSNVHGHGGTGLRYDWQAAQRHFRDVAPHLRLIAAGGLNPNNLAEAIQTLAPWGVDVASGVETAPGRKDPALVTAFIRNAREAFAQQEQQDSQGASRS